MLIIRVSCSWQKWMPRLPLGLSSFGCLLSFCFYHLRTRWWLPNPTMSSHERVSPLFSMVACNIFVNVLYSCTVRFYIHAISSSCLQRKTVSCEEILSKWKLVGIPGQNLPRLTTQVDYISQKIPFCITQNRMWLSTKLTQCAIVISTTMHVFGNETT